jgi:6-phosphofructokinase
MSAPIFLFHQVRAAIVTCGGLCPGLNDVVRQVRSGNVCY